MGMFWPSCTAPWFKGSVGSPTRGIEKIANLPYGGGQVLGSRAGIEQAGCHGQRHLVGIPNPIRPDITIGAK